MSYPPPGPGGYGMYGAPQGYGGMPQPGAPYQPPPLGFGNMSAPPPATGGMPMPMPGQAPAPYHYGPGGPAAMPPPAPVGGMPMPGGPGMPMPGSAPPPQPGYGPPSGPLSFGSAAIATTAFPSHYRAMQGGGPPMPQPNPGLPMPVEAPVNPYAAQSTASAPPPSSYPTASAPPPLSHPTTSAPPPLRHPTTSGGTSSARHGRPSVTEWKPFDPKKDADTLRKAMKGLGCDSKAITYLLCSRTNGQRQRISLEYKTMHGRDLMKDLKSELGGHFEDTVIALMTLPAEYDATMLRKAIKGLGTDEAVLIEILTTRSNDEIIAIKNAYTKLFSRDLEKDIAGDTSGHFKKFLISLANANRIESGPVDITKAQQDAQALYKAGEGRWGTNESKFNSILASRSFAQLRAIFSEYSKICKYDIEDSIKREMSGDLRDGMVTVVRVVRNAPAYFAEKLYKSMKGLGTDDKLLIRVVVTRSEVDMLDIRDEFHKMYGTSLGKFISDDTKGNYKKILLQLVGEPV